jgi:hypothetical protein
MQKGNLSNLITLISDVVFKIKLMGQVEKLKNLLQDMRKLKKKLPLIGLLLGFLIAGMVSAWGLIIIIGVFELHDLSLSWLHALVSMFFVNLVMMGLVIALLSLSLKKSNLNHEVK